MNWFNQKLFLENEIRQTFAEKKPGGNWTAAKFYLVQEFLTNSSTQFRKFWQILQAGSGLLAEKESQIRAHPVWPNMEVPPGYSYGELTIENIKETYIRHFTRQFQLRKNVACNVLAIWGMYPVRSFWDKITFVLFFPRGSRSSSHLGSRWYITSYTRPRGTLSQYSCRIFLCVALYRSCFPGPASSISTALRTCAWIIRNRRPTFPSSSPPDLEFFKRRNKMKMSQQAGSNRDPTITSLTL